MNTQEIIELPSDIVEALVQLGLRTEVGAAIIAGFRAGHPTLKQWDSPIRITVAHDATITAVTEDEQRRSG